MNQTQVMKAVTEAVEAVNLKLGKAVKKDRSRTAFNFGESWATAGFADITDKTTVRPVLDVYERPVGFILIKKQKVPGMKGLTEIFVTPADTIKKGREIWSSDWGYLSMSIEAVVEYLTKEVA